jgi:hypothetical protein
MLPPPAVLTCLLPLPTPPAEAQEFQKKFEEAKAINAELLGTVVSKESDDEEAEADKLADEVEKKL